MDRSIGDPKVFLTTNVMGTHTLLEAALAYWRRRTNAPDDRIAKFRFLQVSTDEVYGSLGLTGKFTESTGLSPNSPYSASKTSADMLVRAWWKTFGVPALVTRCSNNYGPYQFPEKFIPLMIINALQGKDLPIYGDGENVRDWIYVDDHCEAIETVLERGRVGEVYNIGAGYESTNISLIKNVIKLMNKPESLITYIKDRPGHDRRYAIDPSKIMNTLGWSARTTLDSGLKTTIDWYTGNRAWWDRIKSGEYMKYYEKNYSSKGLKSF